VKLAMTAVLFGVAHLNRCQNCRHSHKALSVPAASCLRCKNCSTVCVVLW